MDEDQEICRVCRCESTDKNPLYYPCKCAGSIRFVHQNCLLEWLSHSKKKYCELCEHPFIFTPIYRQDMPTMIPVYILIKQCLSRCGTIMKTGFRALLVAIVWLVLLPYMTLWSWRFYFWSSESIGGGDFTSRPQFSSNKYQQVHYESGPVSSPSTLFDYNLWKFLADCFEGQVITLLIIVVVVTAYLFREWVVQNTPVEADQESEIEQEDLETLDDDNKATNNNGIRRYQHSGSIHNDNNDIQPVSPLARQKVAVHVLLTALGNMDDGSDNGGNNTITTTTGKNDIKCKLKDLQHDLQHELEQQRKQHQHQDPHCEQHRLFNGDDRYQLGSNDDDDEAEIESMMQSIMIKDPADAFKRYSWDDLQNNNHKQQRRRRQDNQQLPISKPSNRQSWQTTFSPPPINRIFDNTETMIIGRSSTTITALEDECDHTNLTSFSRGQCESPRTTTRTDLYCNHQPTVNRLSTTRTTSPLEKKHRHNNPHTDNDDILSRPLISTLRSSSSFSQLHSQASTETATESDEIHTNQPRQSLPSPNIESHDYKNSRNTQRTRTEQQDRNNDRPEPLEIFDINDRILNDEDDEDGAFDLDDDIDGVLEAIGMRGNPWILLQNSVLVCVIVSLCLGIAIWIPHITGQLVILVRPISLIEQVIYVLRYVTDPITDPITDGILDGCFPLLLLTAKKLNSWLHFLVPDNRIFAGRSILTNFMAMAGPPAKKGYSLLSSAPSSWSHNGGVQSSPPGNLLTGKNGTTAFMARHSLADQYFFIDINYWIGLLLNPLCIISEKMIQRWHQFAVGKSALDRGMCIAVGYVTLLTVGSWYLSHYQQCNNENGNGRLYRKSGAGINELIRQQGIFFKVFSFLMLELVLLPIICGILLDLANLPLIENSSISTRWAFTMAHPYCGCFLHWFVGIAFMFHFAVFVKLCREIVRPGVMWFIRDPNDPQFHPVQEIMEQPLLLQLRKLCTGALIYLALIVLGMGTVTWVVSQYTGIYPLRWSFNEPLSTLAIDILAAQSLIPHLVEYVKLRDFTKQALIIWWRTASRWLRLSSFMFGERYPEEEGTFIRQTVKSWLLCEKSSTLDHPNSSLSLDENGVINVNVSFKADGQLVRVPKRDSVMVHSGRSMIVPVDPATLEPLDPMEKCLGHHASTEENGGEEHDTTIVYVPPQFKFRVVIFLFMMWFSGSIMTCSVTVTPLLLGRSLFKTYLAPNKSVHDLYSFVLGAYVIVLLSKTVNWIARGSDYYFKRYEHGGWLSLLDKTRTHIRQKMLYGCRFTILTLTIGWMIPLLVGVAIDLYIFTPIRYTKASHNQALVLYLSEDWSFGIVCLGIVYRIIYILPTNTWQRTLNQYIADGLMTLNVWTLTSAILGPWIIGALCAILVPGGLAWVVIHLLDVQDASMKLMIVRCVYPIVCCLALVLSTVVLGAKLVHLWMRSIRDDTYLVGKQLHNLDTSLGSDDRNAVLASHSMVD